MRTPFLLLVLLVATVSAVFLGGLSGVGFHHQVVPPQVVSPEEEGVVQTIEKGVQTVESRVLVSEEESNVLRVVEQSSPAVVSVLGEAVEKRIIGSGFSISPDGTVITNAHVVDNPTMQYSIVTRDGKTFPVLDIAKSQDTDLAVLRTAAIELPWIKLGDSNKVMPGQSVIAIGSALGSFDQSVTVGVVSGVGREVSGTYYYSDGTSYSDRVENGIIQVDAAINSGNSGGPLLNSAGEVIGVNFAFSKDAENVGYAIPVSKARSFVASLAKEGSTKPK